MNQPNIKPPIMKQAVTFMSILLLTACGGGGGGSSSDGGGTGGSGDPEPTLTLDLKICRNVLRSAEV